MGYLTTDEYRAISTEPVQLDDAQLQKVIRDASRDVDNLTYNRIPAAGGLENLTPYQQELVKEATCQQVDFLGEYGEMLKNPLSSYGINGVSMAWDSTKTVQFGGVCTTNGAYALLQQTGLCCRALP